MTESTEPVRDRERTRLALRLHFIDALNSVFTLLKNSRVPRHFCAVELTAPKWSHPRVTPWSRC